MMSAVYCPTETNIVYSGMSFTLTVPAVMQEIETKIIQRAGLDLLKPLDGFQREQLECNAYGRGNCICFSVMIFYHCDFAQGKDMPCKIHGFAEKVHCGTNMAMKNDG